ncbi:hypothetical protein GOV10_03240 [Candidatus Woesearchaeota archaeon]|nr:hypothetical protein [Candidatus Woesearchaeota archaeon]
MKQEISYQGQFKDRDVLELYSKIMTNMGPLNRAYEKSVSYDTDLGDRRIGIAGFSMVFYLSPLDAYFGSQLMQCGGRLAKSCNLERSSFFGLGRRSISLENLTDDTIRVEIEASPRSVKKMKKVLNQLFVPDLEQEELARQLIDTLTTGE